MLKLGVVGLSEGNGHPYSWSAIINGDYDDAAMERCGFPVIPAYLGANRDTLGIEGARVTHVWTQDRGISELISRASGVEHVVDRREDMVGQVDGVILARDDPENHVANSRPFLEAGVPLYIDKPLAFCRDDLAFFTEQHERGRFVMSWSALRYSSGNQTARVNLDSLGEIELVIAVGGKDLRKYAIHYLEGMFALLGDPEAEAVTHGGQAGKSILTVEFANGLLATVHVFADIAGAPCGLHVYGRDGSLDVVHGGAYPTFRASLLEVVRSFREGRPRLDFKKTQNVIGTLIAARESLESGGRRVLVW